MCHRRDQDTRDIYVTMNIPRATARGRARAVLGTHRPNGATLYQLSYFPSRVSVRATVWCTETLPPALALSVLNWRQRESSHIFWAASLGKKLLVSVNQEKKDCFQFGADDCFIGWRLFNLSFAQAGRGARNGLHLRVRMAVNL